MKQKEIQTLRHLSVLIPHVLRRIDEVAFSVKPGTDIRSKKEILGELIDSATNYHQTLARFQIKHGLKVFYDQHNWNKYGHYNKLSQEEIICLWERHNSQLLEIIEFLPDEFLKTDCSIGSDVLTIESLIKIYVENLEHYLQHLSNGK